MNITQILGFCVVGTAAGFASGLLGIGGAVVIVPALVIFFGYSQHQAQGTTLFLLLLPTGILAVLQYMKAGDVRIPVSLVMGAFFMAGAWGGAKLGLAIDESLLRKLFALFLVFVAARIFFQK